MAKLPIVSGAEAVKALQRLGFFVDRQRGSHVVLKHVTPQGGRGTAPFPLNLGKSA
jgi:predicted RNA binding protein YcfA (HicA-like mRNA interferase family)